MEISANQCSPSPPHPTPHEPSESPQKPRLGRPGLGMRHPLPPRALDHLLLLPLRAVAQRHLGDTLAVVFDRFESGWFAGISDLNLLEVAYFPPKESVKNHCKRQHGVKPHLDELGCNGCPPPPPVWLGKSRVAGCGSSCPLPSPTASRPNRPA